MVIGYGNESNEDDARATELRLIELGCERIFMEKVDKNIHEEEFNNMKDFYRPNEGDVLVVVRLGTFPITLNKLVAFFSDIESKSGKLQINGKVLDLSFFPKLHAYAIRTAKDRREGTISTGKKRLPGGGRKPGIVDEYKAQAAAQMYELGEPRSKILEDLEFKSTNTYYRYLKHAGVTLNKDDE